jgi:SAM-dependent methyltransferase
MGRMARACWCGGELGKEIGPHYRCCNACGAAVLAVLPAPEHFDVSDDERDFYGRRYWTDYSRARGLPDIHERVRSDLSERCLFWLERLLEVAQPPGRALEIGCAHGGFVRIMQDLGFNAVGTELSGWVVEFAKRRFDVPVLRGRLDTLDLEPGFSCIAAFDVLEHLQDPLETARRCGDLLAPGGVLLLQTPWYRGEGPDWSMFQEAEHIHLFTEASIRLLLARAGFRDVLVRPSLFPYDMWVVATRGQLALRTADEIGVGGDWRLPVAFRSLLDLSRQIREVREELVLAEVDRAARLKVIEAQGRQLGEAEAERNNLSGQLENLRGRLENDIRNLQARLAKIEGTWVWRFYRTLPSWLTGRRRPAK